MVSALINREETQTEEAQAMVSAQINRAETQENQR
jgi:hypothetical protein